MFREIGSALQRYWLWTTSGSRWRLAAGIGGPLLVLLVAANSLGSESGDPSDTTPTSFVQSVANASRSAATGVSAPSASPTARAAAASASPTPRAATTYTVKSGDSLVAICVEQLAAMSPPTCVAAIVDLNRLSGPDQLAVGQALSLPAGVGAAVAGPEAAVAGPASTTGQPLPATVTPGPPASTAPTQPVAAATSQPGQVGGGATGRTWYTSSHSSGMFYYCDLDVGWQGLSPDFRRSYPSEAALLQDWQGKRTKNPTSRC